MGVKNLWDILESCKKTLPLHHLQNKRVCIDLSCWMVQLQNVSKSHSCVKQKVYLRGLFHRLRALIAVNCTVVFVTDRSIPAIKLSTHRRRLNSRSEDGCFTLDSDVFLFGERTVYNICLGDGGYVTCYDRCRETAWI